jgi:hypothetical protein
LTDTALQREGHTQVETKASQLVVFALLAALLATFLTDYRYGEVAFEEIDPMVRRVLDSNYLVNDFLTNATDEFGPRFYSVRFIAALATENSLPYIYFGLTLAINFSIALLSGFLARDVFKSTTAGLLSVALAMGASTFQLGGAGETHAGEPNSYWMSFPFVIAAVWAATRRRPVLTGVASGIATLLHPSFGPAVAGMIFMSLAVALWIRRRTEGDRFPIAGFALGVALLAAFLAAVALPYASQETISEARFFEILIFRVPHHLLPSTFASAEWLQGASFLIAVALASRYLRLRGFPDHFSASLFVALASCLLLFFLAGYLFVEIWPWKPFFIAIPYRATSFFTWLGFIALGGSIAARIDRTSKSEGGFLFASMVNPVSVALGHLALAPRIVNRSRKFLMIGGALAIAVGTVFTDLRSLAQFLAVGGLAGWFVFGPQGRWARAVGIGAPIALATALVVFQSIDHTSNPIDRVGPEILPSHVEGPEVVVAAAAQALTPPEAVILTPPTFGTFRLLAERAIVVDVHVIPYQERAMAEWMERVLTVYGSDSALRFESEDLGSDGLDILRDSYVPPNDATVRELRSAYGATHAVFPIETPTEFPVRWRGDDYVLVELADP